MVWRRGGFIDAAWSGWQCVHQALRQKSADLAREGQKRPDALRIRRDEAQYPAQPAFAPRSFDPSVDLRTPNVQQAAVSHARGARGFARQARETTVKVNLRGRSGVAGLKHLLYQVDPAPRPVQFVT